jgi:hypothetical protein
VSNPEETEPKRRSIYKIAWFVFSKMINAMKTETGTVSVTGYVSLPLNQVCDAEG